MTSRRHGESCTSWLTRSTTLSAADDPVSELRGGQLVRVVPESDRHVVELQWAVPPEQRLYREAPAAYLSHLLGCGHVIVVFASKRCGREASINRNMPASWHHSIKQYAFIAFSHHVPHSCLSSLS